MRQTRHQPRLLPIAVCALLPALAVEHVAAGSAFADNANAHSARDAEVTAIRVGTEAGRTRLVFDLSAPASYRMRIDEQPPRIVMDIAAARDSSVTHAAAPLQGTPVREIISTRQADGTVSYEIALRDTVVANAFVLKPYRQAGDRIVLDLTPTIATATAEPAASAAAPVTVSRSRTMANARSTQPTASGDTARDSGPGEWSGSISLQTRLFFSDPAYPEQDHQNMSVAAEPEYYRDWRDGQHRFAFRPFARYDANDEERTHADLRELYWRGVSGPWVAKAGVDVVFWGVTESRHLVDIINQTDAVEDIDGEDKLGQPMLNLDYLADNWGTWQVYLLPWFRERTFPGEDGRLRTEPVVDTDDPLWQSGDEEKHLDWAVRWSQYVGDWDVGLAHFSGTARDPLFVPAVTHTGLVLRPYYQQIDQSSLDVQTTKGAWLWKLEAIYSDSQVEDFYATTGGFEYTAFGIGNTGADLGWLLEYSYDQRGESLYVVMQNDVYAGVRLTGNDVAGTWLLGGVTLDLDNHAVSASIEALRRLGEDWTLGVEARGFFDTDRKDPLHMIRDDDYIQLQLDRYF